MGSVSWTGCAGLWAFGAARAAQGARATPRVAPEEAVWEAGPAGLCWVAGVSGAIGGAGPAGAEGLANDAGTGQGVTRQKGEVPGMEAAVGCFVEHAVSEHRSRACRRGCLLLGGASVWKLWRWEVVSMLRGSSGVDCQDGEAASPLRKGKRLLRSAKRLGVAMGM
jgi:hypothetical protein